MDILAILNRVEVLLKESGSSKSDLYTACSLSASAVSQWKSGKTRPSTKSLQRIADYLHVSYEYLISGAEQKEKVPTPEGERGMSEPMILLNRAAKNMTLEQHKKLLEMSKLMFKEAFDD